MTTEVTDIVTCPSGLVGEVRPIRIVDVKSLSSGRGKNRGRSGDRLSKFVSGLWVRTVDPGVYPESITREDGNVDWSNALLGDRSFLIYESRRITYGNDFYFDVVCPYCGERVRDVHIDLSSIKITGLSDEAKYSIFHNGIDNALFDAILPKSGRSVKVKLYRGYDQTNVSNAIKNNDDDSADTFSMLARLQYIEGCGDPTSRRNFVETMNVVDAEYLRDIWEYHDITIQDDVEIECECGTFFNRNIPIGGGFFSTKSTQKKTKNATS